MYKLETRNKPRSKTMRETGPDAQCVRVYKNSPEDLILQIWNDRRFMLVALYPQEARAIAEALVNVADEMQLGERFPAAELEAMIVGSSVQCPHCRWGFHPSVIDQHIREKHDHV